MEDRVLGHLWEEHTVDDVSSSGKERVRWAPRRSLITTTRVELLLGLDLGKLY